MNIFWCLKNSLATNPKELVANWPLKKKKINLEGCLSINRRSKLHAVIDCLLLLFFLFFTLLHCVDIIFCYCIFFSFALVHKIHTPYSMV